LTNTLDIFIKIIKYLKTKLLKYQIALTKLKGIGPILAKNLFTYFGDVVPIFEENSRVLSSVQGIGMVLAKEIVEQRENALMCAEREIEFLRKKNIKPHFLTDKTYPYRLKECLDAPLMLYSRGNCDFNNGKFLAIVGTRKITTYGKDLCQQLVQNLSQRHSDLIIVSGLAYGVDICAHKSALNAQIPTIGVVAHGLDKIYPSAHYAIADKMLQQGAVVSEYTSGTLPDAPNFVQRNRIIAGLCDAVVIVESAQKGGALITAEFANSYNRDVFTFPGRVDDINSQGCNNLIMCNKAALIQSAEDLERMMGWNIVKTKNEKQQTFRFEELSEDEQKIIAFLTKEREAHINIISNETGISISVIASLLIELEFKDIIKCLPGSNYRLR